MELKRLGREMARAGYVACARVAFAREQHCRLLNPTGCPEPEHCNAAPCGFCKGWGYGPGPGAERMDIAKVMRRDWARAHSFA